MKTSLKLIPGAMLVLLFLITACNLYRRPIPDEMIESIGFTVLTAS